MTTRDLRNVTLIGAEVGILFQPIIANLWSSDIGPALTARLGFAPAPIFVHLAAFVGFTALAPLALWVLSALSTKIAVLYQFGKFAAVGSSNAFVDIGLLNFILLTTGVGKDSPFFVVIATSTALIATVNSFLWNKFWTFEAAKTSEQTWKEVAKFYVVTGVAAIVNGGVTWLFVHSIGDTGISEKLLANIGKVVGIFSALFINFLGYKFFVFKKQPENQSTSSPS